MRHLGSLLAGLIVTPVSWVLLAYGQTGLQAGWDHRETLVAVRPWWEKVAVLAAAGLLLGLVACTRISPAGPLLAGVLYTGFGVTALWRKEVYDLLPGTLRWHGRTADLPVPALNGTAVVVGVMLLTAVLSVRRWQRWPERVTPAGVVPAPRPAAPEEEPVGTGEALAADREAALRADQPTESVVADGYDQPGREWSRPAGTGAAGTLIADPAPATIPGVVPARPEQAATPAEPGSAAEPSEPASPDGPAPTAGPAVDTAPDIATVPEPAEPASAPAGTGPSRDAERDSDPTEPAGSAGSDPAATAGTGPDRTQPHGQGGSPWSAPPGRPRG